MAATELSAFTVVLSFALIALGLVLRRLSQRYGYRWPVNAPGGQSRRAIFFSGFHARRVGWRSRAQ